jgi:oxygen-independent coproporphyrinogen-3 oxidase
MRDAGAPAGGFLEAEPLQLDPTFGNGAVAPLLAAMRPVPRYTSYPTAPHFNAGVGAATQAEWLRALKPGAALSLYAHIPFCDTLCWFCGCSTKITQRYEPVARHLAAIEREAAAVAELAPPDAAVSHIHWGGGSPTMLSAADILRLMNAFRCNFRFSPGMEFAVEIDPRGLDAARIDALAEAGLTRVSIGVQDFDPEVQAAINRRQSVDETAAVVEAFRAHGVRSLNIDAIYGLPGQSWERLAFTLREVVGLRPDRIALFGYAHVPWMKTHQKLIPESALPGVQERHAHAEAAARLLVEAGYARIGIDHFALPHDAMAEAARDGTLTRNFQGYTVDHADALVGLGASSISRFPQGYVQNEIAIAAYERMVAAGGLAGVRGLAFSQEDVTRAAAIERLMCRLDFDGDALLASHGERALALIATAEEVLRDDRYGLVEREGAGFRITETGRPFARLIAARFDAYLQNGAARHSLAV